MYIYIYIYNNSNHNNNHNDNHNDNITPLAGPPKPPVPAAAPFPEGAERAFWK